MYTEVRALLKSMLDFVFIFGLCVLRMILMNTSNLNSYVQGKKIDVATEDKCENLWDLAVQNYEKVKVLIEAHPNLEFQDHKAPRLRKIPMKLQVSIASVCEAIDNYWINNYFVSLDLAINELESTFSKNYQDILCALK